jgi:chorismate--pyruvate lyase
MNWTKWFAPQRRLMPAQLHRWLTDSGSLTRRLQQHNSNGFSVELLGNHWLSPLVEESRYMHTRPNQMAFQREVRLMDGKTANVYARTVIPLATFNTMKQRFIALGNKPLGEMLFTDPTVKRGEIQIARLKPGEWLYEMALLEENYRPQELWGRRSPFFIGGKILLVNEIFLPTLLED